MSRVETIGRARRAALNLARKAAEKPKDFYTCTACGTGPWHKSWTAKHEPKWCPDCTGAW